MGVPLPVGMLAYAPSGEALSVGYHTKNKIRIKENMKIKEGFVLREMCGEWIVTGESLEQVNFNKLIALNPTAVYLWKAVEGKEFDAEQLADLLVEKYHIAREQALHDAEALCKTWQKIGIVE